MKTLMASALLTLIAASLTTAQHRSYKQTYDLKGPVKVVRETTVYFDYQDGKFSALPSKEPEKAVKVFDREGTLLFPEWLDNLPPCGFRTNTSFELSKSVYDATGNLIEYMTADTLEHSSYRLKYIYDSRGRLIETEHYDPYALRYKWIYTYEEGDEYGNWTARTVTPIKVNTTYDRLQKREEYRMITYY